MINSPTITTFPRHPLRDVWARNGQMHPILASFDRLYTSGRDAIYWGLKCFDPNQGKCVWIPSFHCGVEVQAALDAGFDVNFYQIRPDLSIDEEDLKQKIEAQPGPVMVIHYFGFAQPGLKRLAELCERRGAVLIEDCSHALFSTLDGQLLGQYGHFAAYSLYKTLGLCDGGALWLDRKRCERIKGWPLTTPPRGRPALQGYKVQIRAMLKRLFGAHVARRYWTMRSGNRNLFADSRIEKNISADHPLLLHPHNYRGGMSILSQRLASTMDPSRIFKRRQENWRFLDARLSLVSGYRNVFGALPEGTCPLFLTICVSHREILRSKLSDQNIETFVFGRYPHPLLNVSIFPWASAMRKQILCLPLHQYMDESQLTRLVATVGPLLDEHDVKNEVNLEGLDCP